jgi:uncharacterized protein YecE (DUF72 family)
MKKLKDPEEPIHRLFESITGLEEKLAVVLFQLPPAWKLNMERFETFLSILPRGHRYTVEFRELSWMTPEVDELLRRYNVAFCIYELAGYMSPLQITADFTYVRLHGPTLFKYQGSYSDKALATWAKQIAEWSRSLRAIYVYFDNDDSAHAVYNALRLQELVRAELGKSKKITARPGSRPEASK